MSILCYYNDSRYANLHVNGVGLRQREDVVSVIALARMVAIVMIILLANGMIGYVMAWNRPATITQYNATGQPHFVFVELAGLGNSGEITSTPFRDMLRKYGHVLVVEYPRYAFDVKRIDRQVRDKLIELNLPVIFDTQSMGSMLGVEIMRDPLVRHVTAGFIGDCPPHTAATDVKWPVPPGVLTWIPGGPLTNWLIDVAMLIQARFDGQAKMPHGDSEKLYRRHRWHMHTFPFQGSKPQVKFMREFRGPAAGEFANVPTLFFWAPDDVLVHTDKARPKMEAAFPNHESHVVPGVHANRVENPAERRTFMEAWIVLLIAERA